MEDDSADTDIDSDCTGDDAGSDVVYVKREGWARCSAFFIYIIMVGYTRARMTAVKSVNKKTTTGT